MPRPSRPLTPVVALLAMTFAHAARVDAAGHEARSDARHALHTGIAVVANIVPVVSTLYVPRCLPGYVVCKVMFAGVSLIAAVDQVLLSRGGDLSQTSAILHRGFAGDWYLTPRHVSGEVTPEVLPDPPPPTGATGEWKPPPL